MKHLVAMATLLLVLLVVLVDTERTSPGPLSAVHFQNEDLRTSKGCVVCHGTDERDTTSSCLECHAPVADQLVRGAGVHGQLDVALARDCAACHGEHLGESFAPVSDMSFALAGIEDPSEYDHAGLEWELLGRHTSLGCEECHANAWIETLPVGERRFLGLSQRCASCHDDPHDGSYGADCAACHGQVAHFDQVAEFEHPERYPLTGAHSGLACRECHVPGSANAIDQLAGPLAGRLETLVERDSCGDCHTDPHDGAFLARVSRELGTTLPQSCVRCHRATHGTFRGRSPRMTSELHASTGFPLGAPHADVECSQCHPGFGTRDDDAYFAAAFLQRDRGRCEACHADPHFGQFADGAFAGKCTECHADDAFAPSEFGIGHHGRTQFSLTGAHAAVACSSCHEGTPTARYDEAPLECARCHADPHGGRFDREDLPKLVAEREGCARCHTTETFYPAIRDAFDHGRWTRYELVGKHADAACEDCHRATPEGRAAGLHFGRSPGASCADCHADVHLGQFEGTGGTDCARCHAESGDSFAAVRFDHQTDARFALDERHRDLACSACHERYPLDDTVDVVRYVPLGTRCVDCHDPGSVDD